MRTFLIIVILLINIFAILLNCKMLKGIGTNKLLMYLFVQEIVLLIIGKIIFNISTANIDSEVSSTSQNMILFLFQGMNMILISSPLAKILGDYDAQKNKNKTITRKLLMWLVFTIIVIIIECTYIKNIESGIANMKHKENKN